MTHDEKEIKRKLRILQHVDPLNLILPPLTQATIKRRTAASHHRQSTSKPVLPGVEQGAQLIKLL